jgi:hypothetical protein
MQIATSTHVLIEQRNKLWTQRQRTHGITVRPLVDSLKEQLKSAIKEQLSNTWQKTLQELDTNNMRETWTITKCLINKH